ncbi:hypothetical protein NEIRO03_1282 [Nematocida sp. AWRm78]|nr:hypothetical protein NEIRO02_0577 [Nematocida sp. AWRm79]KAI5183706.1 hypothetical protein NEIRO03_1282 [Nematocida sp. AWRm78]
MGLVLRIISVMLFLWNVYGEKAAPEVFVIDGHNISCIKESNFSGYASLQVILAKDQSNLVFGSYVLMVYIIESPKIEVAMKEAVNQGITSISFTPTGGAAGSDGIQIKLDAPEEKKSSLLIREVQADGVMGSDQKIRAFAISVK